jgi:CBS domain containing-hemolysin-like protein
VRLDEATHLLGADWQGSSATLAGFLMERIERLPRSGEEFVIDGVPVEVERMEGRTVVSLLAWPVHRRGEGA